VNFSELSRRDINVTPEQRENQQDKGIAPIDSDLLVGILKDTNLDKEDEEHNE
jgi:hypothetical protein